MAIQKIFTAGNSQVVAIPPEVLDLVELKKGDQVHITAQADTSSITITKVKPATQKSSKTKQEFNTWLEKVLEEDAPLLEELSNR